MWWQLCHSQPSGCFSAKSPRLWWSPRMMRGLGEHLWTPMVSLGQEEVGPNLSSVVRWTFSPSYPTNWHIQIRKRLWLEHKVQNTLFTFEGNQVAKQSSASFVSSTDQAAKAPVPDDQLVLKASLAITSWVSHCRIPRHRLASFSSATTGLEILSMRWLTAVDSARPMLKARATWVALSQSCTKLGHVFIFCCELRDQHTNWSMRATNRCFTCFCAPTYIWWVKARKVQQWPWSCCLRHQLLLAPPSGGGNWSN